jgi:hypothetical protein
MKRSVIALDVGIDTVPFQSQSSAIEISALALLAADIESGGSLSVFGNEL